MVFGGDVTLTDNAGEAYLEGNVVRGDLTCADNSVAPVVANNRIRGEDLCEGATTATAKNLSRSAQVDTEDRKAGIQAKIEKRTTTAEMAAERAGEAFGSS